MSEDRLLNGFKDLFTDGITSPGSPPTDWKGNQIPNPKVPVTKTSFTVQSQYLAPFSSTYDKTPVNNPAHIAQRILEEISFPGTETSFIHINIPLPSGYKHCLKEICREINALAANMNNPAIYFINVEAYDYTNPNIYNHICYNGFLGLKLAFGVSSKRPVQPKCKLTSPDTDFPAHYMD